ncbi:MAG: hypothetical protein ABNH21_15140 [Glaciecola sp.]|jgi:hypothetical protein
MRFNGFMPGLHSLLHYQREWFVDDIRAAVVTPLASGDSIKHWRLGVTMTAMTGFWCIPICTWRLKNAEKIGIKKALKSKVPN